MKSLPLSCCLLGLGLAIPACDTETEAPATRSIELAFGAMIGDQPFSCASTYEGLGVKQTRVAPLDFRMYVHDVRLVRKDGQVVPVTLEQDGAFQRDAVALIDFEDGTGTCQTGSPELHTKITGTVPAGDDYVAVRFALGLPESLNHLDAATAPAPFNIPGMWWAWKGGYKFVRLDLQRLDMPAGEEGIYYFHLGATTCDGTPGQGFSCAFENSAEIELALDVDRDTIVFDVASLYASADLSLQPDFVSDFVAGCMAFEGDPECPDVFARLGMTFEANAPLGEQTVLRVVKP